MTCDAALWDPDQGWLRCLGNFGHQTHWTQAEFQATEHAVADDQIGSMGLVVAVVRWPRSAHGVQP